jgi:hypothetical protein
MPMIEAVKVIVPLRKAAVLEPIPTVVTLNESITITVLETATLAALGEPWSTPPGPGMALAAAVMARHCAVMATMAPTAAVTARHCAVMATMAPTAASITSAATMAPTIASAVAAAPTAASITSAATMASTIASAVAAASAAPAATPAPAVAASAAAATTTAAMAHEGHCATGAESAFQVGDTCRLSRPPHKGR